MFSRVKCKPAPSSRALFLAGYREMMERLRPSAVMFCGIVPEACRSEIIIPLAPFQDEMKKRMQGDKAAGGMV